MDTGSAPTATVPDQSGKRGLCRTIEEIREAAREAAALQPAITPEQRARVLALLAPYRDQLIMTPS